MQLGQPLFWMTINPADSNSPFVMQLAGVDLDVCGRLKTDLPKYVKRLQLIAADPVASADFFHIMIEAVLKTLLRFGARDGDGGVLGRIKAYVGMTEEQRRLTLHCHLLVWVFGFNDFSSLRDLMDKTPGSYQDLAEPLERLAKECITVPPPSACFPPPGVERDVATEDNYLLHFHSELADITRTANMHACTFTCHKHGHVDTCRCVRTAEDEEEMHRFDSETDAVLHGTKSFATVAERFTSKQRREHGKVNSYNPIIAFCTRSNMDIKALLGDSDARGALFYILNYSTKTETTMDALLNVLAPVVERIKDETDGAPAATVAAQMVRSCSCKTVAHMSIGAPAAASKVLGYND
ncbi:unnamed protein product, partial [Laminaria digitata]